MAAYLVDTNIISQAFKDRDDCPAFRWLKSVPASAVYISAITVGELYRGLELMPFGIKKQKLGAWIKHTIEGRAYDNVIPVTDFIARCWGVVYAKHKNSPHTPDHLIAATAYTRDLILVTRNIKDMPKDGSITVINPYDETEVA